MRKITIITLLTFTFTLSLFAQTVNSESNIPSGEVNYQSLFYDSMNPSQDVISKIKDDYEDEGRKSIKVGLGTEIEIITREYYKLGGPTTLHLTGEFNGSRVELEWLVTFYKNTSHFILERSGDRMPYTQICRINREGHVSQSNDYQFVEANSHTQTHYYRIKVISKDGNIMETKTISLLYVRDGSDLVAVYPNPNQGETLSCKYAAEKEGDVRVQVVSASGKALLVSNQTVKRGFNTFDLDISNLNTGLFFVTIINNRKTTTQRFNVLR